MADVVIDGDTGAVEGEASSFNAQVQKTKFVEAVKDAGVEVPALQALDEVLREERRATAANQGKRDLNFVNGLSQKPKSETEKKKGFLSWLLGD